MQLNAVLNTQAVKKLFFSFANIQLFLYYIHHM